MTRLAVPLFGPAFSTFSGDQVQWLLTDYSDRALERSVHERETLIQSGKRHYAEDLPIERVFDPEYLNLATRLLTDCAGDVAIAVEVVTDAIASIRPNGIVLVSLVRAGVPAGIWIRDCLMLRHGIGAQHFAISIVKGHGVDRNAMSYLSRNIDPSQVIFIDGWTGKGSISRELEFSISQLPDEMSGFSPELAVLADPGGFAAVAGTRQDLLIPTAAFNSTSCGLISRTVLPPDTSTGSGFHGAKFYRDFLPVDRSEVAINAVTELLSKKSRGESSQLTVTPTDMGRLAAHLNVQDSFMKPGIGETTRVLQRRVPERVFVDPRRVHDRQLIHVHTLARQLHVPLELADTAPFACVGVIKPLHLPLTS